MVAYILPTERFVGTFFSRVAPYLQSNSYYDAMVHTLTPAPYIPQGIYAGRIVRTRAPSHQTARLHTTGTCSKMIPTSSSTSFYK